MSKLLTVLKANWVVIMWTTLISCIIFLIHFSMITSDVSWSWGKLKWAVDSYWNLCKWYWLQLLLSLMVADLVLFGWWQSKKNLKFRFFLEWGLVAGMFIYWGYSFGYPIFYYTAALLFIGIYLKMRWVVKVLEKLKYE
ncbi:hypothetical protein [Gynurincola endophyticus]|jgi:hypothetical protein|uniref:hypothetical protein n=1 Tax=Gynurincola endophyticus TaxID=2479004 RepID=UPI000F8F6042|nr:hypothetical protein [Gynurincola endophyticus]